MLTRKQIRVLTLFRITFAHCGKHSPLCSAHWIIIDVATIARMRIVCNVKRKTQEKIHFYNLLQYIDI